MKKAVITILGTISCCDIEGENCNEQKRAYYETDDKIKEVLTLKYTNYTNMLPILIENFYPEYELVPIYTEDKYDNEGKLIKGSKTIQASVLKKCENDKFSNIEEISEKIFANGIPIKNENDFKTILKNIDKKIREYDEVVIDVSHGFRHLPILMTVDLIVTSLKSESKDKVKNILFAEEVQKNKRYKIVDLSEYLDLASLAFIINIFKDNYTVSNHIKIKSKDYKELIKLMQKFSKDLMGLSIDNLLNEKDGVVIKLIEKLKDLEGKEILFKEEIKTIREKLETVYTKKDHRYQTFYYIAEDVSDEKRGYLAVAISLMFEGISFYLLYALQEKSFKLKKFFNILTKKAEKNEEKLTYYDILNLCRSVFLFNEKGIIISKKLNEDVSDEVKECLFKTKNEILSDFGFYSNIVDHPLIKLIKDTQILRNNLLHANSGSKVIDVNKEVRNLLKRYKELLIEKRFTKTSDNMGNIRIKL